MPNSSHSVPSEDSPHILVVDDDQRLRDLLQRYLNRSGLRVTTARDAADARAKLRGLFFDLLVVDVMMPGESGLELVQSLKQAMDTPMMLLTAMDAPEDRISGFENGADDYMAKPFEPRELVLRIEAILRRSQRQPQSDLRIGALRFDVARGVLWRGQEEIRLTSSEADILRAFVRKPGATIAREELMRQSGAGNERAVDIQITRLRRKLEPDPKAPKHLQTVWGQGYVLWLD